MNPIDVKFIYADFLDNIGADGKPYEVKVRVKIGEKHYIGILEESE